MHHLVYNKNESHIVNLRLMKRSPRPSVRIAGGNCLFSVHDLVDNLAGGFVCYLFVLTDIDVGNL